MEITKDHYLFTKQCIISAMKLLPEYTDKYQPGMVNRRNKNKPSPTGELKNKGMCSPDPEMRIEKLLFT